MWSLGVMASKLFTGDSALLMHDGRDKVCSCVNRLLPGFATFTHATGTCGRIATAAPLLGIPSWCQVTMAYAPLWRVQL